jgi:hypothetical protein
MLNVAVSELMFALWFLAMAPILKRVEVVFVGNYEREEGGEARVRSDADKAAKMGQNKY